LVYVEFNGSGWNLDYASLSANKAESVEPMKLMGFKLLCRTRM